ncbi:MAG: hypothetical protein EPN34_00520 [Burkholderiaceae bacterium]|nr:MAG: hypothetical protein EPN34_00520 [Burkholderiaceae bacterium]
MNEPAFWAPRAVWLLTEINRVSAALVHLAAGGPFCATCPRPPVNSTLEIDFNALAMTASTAASSLACGAFEFGASGEDKGRGFQAGDANGTGNPRRLEQVVRSDRKNRAHLCTLGPAAAPVGQERPSSKRDAVSGATSIRAESACA